MSARHDLLLDDARHELSHKHRQTIEEETAYKWAARAIVAWNLSSSKYGGEEFRRDAVDYYHEAIEHAALADHSGELLRAVREWIHRYVPKKEL